MSLNQKASYLAEDNVAKRRDKFLQFCNKEEEVGSSKSASLATSTKASSTGDQEPARGEDREKQITMVRNMLTRQFANLEDCNFRRANVRIYNGKLPKSILTFKVKRVVSPKEFYLEVLVDEGYKTYGQLFRDIQMCYSAPGAEEKYALSKYVDSPLPGRCYVCKDFSDSFTWHRVRVYRVNRTEQTAQVFYLDLAKLQIVPFSFILEIDPKLSETHAQLFRAYLFDVLPDSTIPGLEEAEWSFEAHEYIKNVLKPGKELDGIIMAKSDSLVEENMPDVICNIGVVLINKTDSSCTVNAQLVDKKFAQAIGIFGGCGHTAFSVEMAMPVYNKEEFDKMYIAQPSSSESKQPVSSEAGKRSEMQTGAFHRSQVPPPNFSWERFYKGEPDLSEDELRMTRSLVGPDILPNGIAEKICQIKVCYVKSPSRIVGHLQTDVEHLHKMQKALHRYYNLEGQDSELTDIQAGMFIGVRIVDLSKPDLSTSVWCRGFVKHVPPKESGKSQKYMVILVDYGTEPVVSAIQCRKLPAHFLDVPSFAHRFHLDCGVAPAGVQANWSEQACIDFQTYLFKWADDNPLYYIYQPKQASNLELVDIDQEIIYDRTDKKWITNSINVPEVNTLVNKTKYHPMLQSLFVSIGVDIQYEVSVEGVSYWFFQPVIDNALETGGAKLFSKGKGKDRVHMDIVSSYLPLMIQRLKDSITESLRKKLVLVKGKLAGTKKGKEEPAEAGNPLRPVLEAGAQAPLSSEN